jgi:hypothetical protein
MGIRDSGTTIRSKTNACFRLPYSILEGEHITCDGNEMIYRYVTGVFSDIRYDSLTDEEQSLDSWSLIDAVLIKHWHRILRNMVAGIRRFPNSTHITFIMDGNDKTGTIDAIDAIGGQFDIRNALAKTELIFDNYESSDEESDDTEYIADEEITPVYIDSGNSIPSLDTHDMKMMTWKTRNLRSDQNASNIVEGKNKTMEGMFRMTAIAKMLIHDLVNVMDYMNLSVIYANGEADFLIALYCNEGRSFGCITQDTDQLAYGSSLHIVKAAADGLHVRYVPFVLRDLGISQEQLRAWCILLGCDYNTRIKNVGPANALKIVKGEMKLPTEESLSLIAKYDECWNIFSSASGYDYIQAVEYFVSEQRMYEKIAPYITHAINDLSTET